MYFKIDLYKFWTATMQFVMTKACHETPELYKKLFHYK